MSDYNFAKSMGGGNLVGVSKCLIALCAFATGAAYGGWGWKGVDGGDTYWSTASNWNKSTPGDSGYYFRNSLEAFTGYSVTFNRTESLTSANMYVDDGTSADHPIVFSADDSGKGFTLPAQLRIVSRANDEGHLRIESGTYTINRVLLGQGSNAVSRMVVKGGTVVVKEYLCVGMDSVGTEADSYFELDGGTVYTTRTDGGANQFAVIIGDAGNPGQVARICVRSGLLASAKFLSVGRSGAGVLDIEGGDVAATGTVYLVESSGCAAGEDCFLNLKGGTLTAADVKYGSGSAIGTMLFNGGTLRANSNNTLIVKHDRLHVKVGANGGTIDTDGHSVTVAENLESAVEDDPETADVVEKDGGLRFKGGGTVALTGAVSYNGRTTVELGTVLSVSTAVVKTKILANGVDVVVPPGAPLSGTVLTLTGSGTIGGTDLANSVVSGADSDDCGLGVSADGKSIVLVSKHYWNDGPSGASWTAAGKWNVPNAPGDWQDGSIAVFGAADDAATADSDVYAASVLFEANGSVSGSGAANLTAPVIDVADGAEATVSAPIAGVLTKSGPGRLTLGHSRTNTTTLADGTLAMTDGATISATNLKLGADASKPVTFDYGGQTLTGKHESYLVVGSAVTLENGAFAYDGNEGFTEANFPFVYTIGAGAVVTNVKRYVFNAQASDAELTVNIKGGMLISTGTNTGDGTANNYIMNSGAGKLNINVSDGGRFHIDGRVFAMTCHEGNAIAADANPRFNWTFNNASMYVGGSGINFGKYESRKTDGDPGQYLPPNPEGRLSATNSNISSANSIYIGEEVAKNPADSGRHGGWHRAEFDDSTVTTRLFCVYSDRRNSAHFNGATLVLPRTNWDWLVVDSDYGEKWSDHAVTVGSKGFAMDTQTFEGALKADLGGTGGVTKQGTGKLTVAVSQTQAGAAPFEVAEGTLAFSSGVNTMRGVSVKDGAKLILPGGGTVVSGGLSFEAGATLDIAGPNSVTAAVTTTSLALPASGTVAITKNGGSFGDGVYPILAMTGVATNVAEKLAPLTGDRPYSFFLQGDCLCLAVNTEVHGRVWRGKAGDGKLSTPGNWLGCVVPTAGETLDFSLLANSATVDADIEGSVFQTLYMGSKVVTFTGSLDVQTMTNVQNVAVGANSTVTVKGDVVFTTGDTSLSMYIVSSVAAGGRFVVEGSIIASDEGDRYVLPSRYASEGVIVAGRLLSNGLGAATERMGYRLVSVANATNRWAIGEGGIAGVDKFGYFMMLPASGYFYRAEVQPIDGDFPISAWIGMRTGDTLELNTTGLDGFGHTIDIATGIGGLLRDGVVEVTGTGTVLCGYDATSNPYGTDRKCTVNVEDGATLALKPGVNLGTGKVTVKAGGTLKVAESGTAALYGALDLADGAALGFNFTSAETLPVLNVSGRTVTFGENKTLVVRVSRTLGFKLPVDSYKLTSGGKFTDCNLSVAAEAPLLASRARVENGDIVVDLAHGFLMIVR